MKEPTISPLIDNLFGNTLGGDSITKATVEHDETMTMLTQAAGIHSGLASAFGAKAPTSVASIVGGVASDNAATKAISAFMVSPTGKGKALCPSVG